MTVLERPPRAVRQLLGSSRPLSWINTAYPFAAAYLLAGGGVDAALVVGTLFFLVPYNLLMYGINDVFDHDSDLRNPRKGGVEGIVLDRGVHRLTLWAAAGTTLPFVVALLMWGGAVSALVLLVVLAAVIAYSAPGLRFKERPVLDSLTSSTHFVGPAAFGLALTGAPFGLTAPASLAGLLVLPYLVSIWPFRSLSDARAEQAHRGWRRFLMLNLVTGFLLTQLLIVIALTR